jgi:hypothetical protein
LKVLQALFKSDIPLENVRTVLEVAFGTREMNEISHSRTTPRELLLFGSLSHYYHKEPWVFRLAWDLQNWTLTVGDIRA